MLLFLYLSQVFSSGMAENEPNDAKNEVCDADSHSEINRYSNFIDCLFSCAPIGSFLSSARVQTDII